MRFFALLAALLMIPVAAAQDEPKAKKKPAAKKTVPAKQAAHKKPTPEQIRKFKELEKKKKQQ